MTDTALRTRRPTFARLSMIAAAALGFAGPAHATRDAALAQSPVSEAELRAHIAILASDDYGGRMPGTPGETLTAAYIARALAAAGFVGGAADGGFYQPVPLVEFHHPQFDVALRRTDIAQRMRAGGDDAVTVPSAGLYLRTAQGSARIADAPLVFAGHGTDETGRVVADVRGKIALILMANRDEADALPLAQRRNLVLAAGATGVVVIANPAMSAEVMRRGFQSTRPVLASSASTAPVEGVWANGAAAAAFTSVGIDLSAESRAAAAADYSGIAVPLAMTADVTTVRRAYNSYNVVARLPGTRANSGTVMLAGHWDHLGTCREEGAADRICNGAVDNASGIALLIDAARRIAAGPRLDRDVMILATTAEEQGLLGARHYVADPIVPLAEIAVVLNVDTVAIAPRGAPMAMVGRGTTRLDAQFDAVARTLGRAVDSDEEANAFIRRQDGWAFTEAGVPSLMAGGSFSDMALLQAFLGGSYHGPEDELTDDLPLGGAADDADLHIALARHFATIASHPRLRDE